MTMVIVSDLTRLTIYSRNVIKLWTRNRLIALFLSIIVSSMVLLLINPTGSESLYWPGWFILKVSPDIEVSQADELLLEAGITGSLSSSSASVSYMAIPDLERVKISELDDILVPGDPRRDSYLSRISKLFISDGAPLIYLPADRSISSYRKLLKEIPGLKGWQLLDDQTPGMALHLIVFIAAALMVAFFTGNSSFRTARLIAILPLALLVLRMTPAVVFPALLVYFLSPLNFYYRKEAWSKIYIIAVYSGYSLAAVTLFLTLGGAHVLQFLIALISSELIFLLTVRSAGIIRKPGFSRRSEHRLFEPLSLMQPSDRMHSRVNIQSLFRILSLAAVLLTILVPLANSAGNMGNHSPIPHALLNSEGFDSFTSLHNLANRQTAGSLPDVSGMISSAVHNEGFLYGAEYRLPMPGDSLLIRSYKDNGISIAMDETMITLYDEAWFERVLNHELSQGPGLLFASLEGPSSVIEVYKPPGIKGFSFSAVQIVLSGIAVLVILMLIVFPFRGENQVRSIYKPILTARRRAQAA